MFVGRKERSAPSSIRLHINPRARNFLNGLAGCFEEEFRIGERCGFPVFPLLRLPERARGGGNDGMVLDALRCCTARGDGRDGGLGEEGMFMIVYEGEITKE